MFHNCFQNRSVLVTGHTGFKGSWLSQWLIKLGASVHGFALDPKPHERLFDSLKISKDLASDTRADIRNPASIFERIDKLRPDFIFHLAAQPLVRLSFQVPVETFETNVMGTINVLESLRRVDYPCTCVIVTTDKCYENREWLHSYREVDAMGGYDPYSASKGCAELATAAYRQSYFASGAKQKVATARAGNVIGGGDWAVDRIVPDIFRSLFAGVKVPVRNKLATRPWQHVLEPLSGYLWLAACMHEPTRSGYDVKDLTSGFNFGPAISSNRSVAAVVASVLKHCSGAWEDCSDPNAPHEASKLNLAIDKSFHVLGWQPTWDFDKTILKTATWYIKEHAKLDAKALTVEQICEYESDAARSGQNWAQIACQPTSTLASSGE